MSQLDRHLSGATLPEGARAAFLQTGVVVATRAPYALRVRLGVDRFLGDDDLGWCYPLLPPGLLPVEGQLVRVFLPDPGQPQAERYWIGPYVTDYHQTPGQTFPGGVFATTDATWGQIAGTQTFAAADSRYPHFDAPERVHVLTRGRGDAVFTPEGAYLRTARHAWDERAAPNRNNPALLGLVADPQQRTSTALVSAERIALLTQPVAAADRLQPTAAEVSAAADTAHPLAFADVLAEQLAVLRRALVEHVHPGPGKPAVADTTLRELLALDFSRLGSAKLVGN